VIDIHPLRVELEEAARRRCRFVAAMRIGLVAAAAGRDGPVIERREVALIRLFEHIHALRE
jgi:hypothetical protein